jgi:hypothetical protein
MDAASMAVVLTPLVFNDAAHKGMSLEQVAALTSLEGKVVQVLIERHDTVFRAKFHPMSNSLATPPKFSLKMVQNTAEQAQASRGVSILSLDGGGMRGVIEIKILSMLAEEMFGDCDERGTRVRVLYFSPASFPHGPDFDSHRIRCFYPSSTLLEVPVLAASSLSRFSRSPCAKSASFTTKWDLKFSSHRCCMTSEDGSDITEVVIIMTEQRWRSCLRSTSVKVCSRSTTLETLEFVFSHSHRMTFTFM